MPTVFLTHTPDMLANYYGERALAALRELAPVKLNETAKVLDAPALAQAARGCDIIISDRQTAGPTEFFPRVPDLVAFLRVAVDIRNIDTAAASAQGILVTHATPGFVASVAEMAIGYMVDCARDITASTLDYRAGREAGPRMGRQLKGATMGIMGYGAIGEYLAPLGLALGMTVLVSDPFKTVATPGVRQVDLPELLEQSDYVVCLVVANEETENLMNAAAFAQMKTSAVFINLSRGNLVDEQALAEAMAFGLAAVAGATGFAADFLTDGREARIVAPSAEHLGSALLALIEEPENRARLACKGRTVARRFTSERMTLSYENAFDEGLTAILGARG